MRVLIVGAGASRGAQDLPTAADALAEWEPIIRDHYQTLALALAKWVGPAWQGTDLETAWTTIDLAWKEHTSAMAHAATNELTPSERREVWRLALAAAALEPVSPNYYRTQIEWARTGYSTEQFLSVAAGWELRRLIQEALSGDATDAARALYAVLLDQCKPDAVLSFNFDTLIEQCLQPDTWQYVIDAGRLVPVLKPHGSVNWTYQSPPEEIAVGATLQAEAMGYADGRLRQNLIIGLRDKIEHTALEPSRVIRNHYARILVAAEDLLALADSVWVVGYRFAPADTTFLDAVARALARRAHPPDLAVVDYGHPAKLLPRLRVLFNLPVDQQVRHCFHGFAKWVDHGFCVP